MTFRFEFSECLTKLLSCFAESNKTEPLKVYNQRWTQWTNNNHALIMAETTRLEGLGYKGNVIDKLYKGGRFYFRTKSKKEKKQPCHREKYIHIGSSFLKMIDTHTERFISESLPPAQGFVNFCQTHSTEEWFKTEIKNLIQVYDADTSKIIMKLKKTYKNRYFIHTRRRKAFLQTSSTTS